MRQASASAGRTQRCARSLGAGGVRQVDRAAARRAVQPGAVLPHPGARPWMRAPLAFHLCFGPWLVGCCMPWQGDGARAPPLAAQARRACCMLLSSKTPCSVYNYHCSQLSATCAATATQPCSVSGWRRLHLSPAHHVCPCRALRHAGEHIHNSGGPPRAAAIQTQRQEERRRLGRRAGRSAFAFATRNFWFL